MRTIQMVGLAMLLTSIACGSKGSDKKQPADDEPKTKSTTKATDKSTGSSAPAAPTDPTAKWERHSLGSISASFPKKPEPRSQTVDTAAGKMTVETLGIEGDDGTYYALAMSQFPGPIEDTAALLASSQKNSWTKVTDKTLSESKLEKGGFPGFQLKFTNNAANTRPLAGLKRSFVDAKNGRLISAEAVANEKWDEKQALAFLDSISFEAAKPAR